MFSRKQINPPIQRKEKEQNISCILMLSIVNIWISSEFEIILTELHVENQPDDAWLDK